MEEQKHKNVFVALAAAQMAMEPLIKGAINPAFKGEGVKKNGTAYADLSDVVSAVRPALVSNGLAYFHQIIRHGDALDMRTALVHGESDTRIECDVPLIVAKNDMQGMKSATTYAKRIGLESVTGVAPEDDDGNAAAKSAPTDHRRDDRKRVELDPAPFIAAIEASNTGTQLRDAIMQGGCDNDHPAIAAARVERLEVLIKGAQTVVVLDAFQKAFGPDWPRVERAAMARRNELTNADLGGDEIPL